MPTACSLVQQGYGRGSCITRVNGKKALACEATLREEGESISRLIESIHLSRPENYLSIYQSGCNLSCRKCHSWYFSKVARGAWYSPPEIALLCADYAKRVTLREPRDRATAWHAHDACRCCGGCVLSGKRPPRCPGILASSDIVLSPQGFGPARNIVGFTGGDLCCKPDFYAECARLIKEKTELWILIETNGYGLTPEHLNLLREAGVDSFWLDIKAFDDEVHTWLTGCSNREILALPEEMLKYLSQRLEIPVARVYHVATFYSAFSLVPRGEHLIKVCVGTSCHVRGAGRILDALENRLEIEAGQTTEDRLFTLETVNCLGACALSPVVVIDSKYYGDMTLTKLDKLIDEYYKVGAEANAR